MHACVHASVPLVRTNIKLPDTTLSSDGHLMHTCVHAHVTWCTLEWAPECTMACALLRPYQVPEDIGVASVRVVRSGTLMSTVRVRQSTKAVMRYVMHYGMHHATHYVMHCNALGERAVHDQGGHRHRRPRLHGGLWRANFLPGTVLRIHQGKALVPGVQ